MSHLEAAPDEGQEMKSPTASQVRMWLSNLPHSPLQDTPPTSANKRHRSSSWPESVRKRPSLLPEPAPTSEPLKPLLPEPCWACFSPPKAPSDVASLGEEEDIDRLRIPSDDSSTESGTTQLISSISSRRKRKLCLEAGIIYVGPKDEDFEYAILLPLRVFVSTSSARTKPIEIFGLQSSTPDSRVILRKTENQLEVISQDFWHYEERGYDEHTLCTICVDSIVLRDPFLHTSLFGEDQNRMTSVRRDKWKPKKKGPSIPIGEYTYDWDIEPGTTYAVGIQMFDGKHRSELRMEECQAWLAEEAAVCPYLTIEYKKNSGYNHARYQVSAASVLWLHQRKQIRQELGLALTDLKHFSITIIDSSYTIREARFKDDLYYVHDLGRGHLTTIDGLKLYIEWSNAIHTWGLGANASSFKKDIVTLLERQCSQQPFPTPCSTHSPADA